MKPLSEVVEGLLNGLRVLQDTGAEGENDALKCPTGIKIGEANPAKLREEVKQLDSDVPTKSPAHAEAQRRVAPPLRFSMVE